MNNQSKSLLPLVEILISTGIFAIAVVLTLQLFLLAKFLGIKTSDSADAILKVQHIAETMKLFETDSEIDYFLGSEMINTGNVYNLYYDINWQLVNNIDEAVFITDIYIEKSGESAGSLYKYSINLYKTEPYPFIDDKKTEQDAQYKPLLASVSAGKFINNN